MAFIDQVTLTISAGKGGDGVVRWRREKRISHGGPYGGDGGDGGDVYVQGIRNLHALNHYRHEKEFSAQDGFPGDTKLMHGKCGEDLVLSFPLGTKITNTDLDISYELLEEGQKILILRGGRGGLGNHNFKNSIRRAPEIATPGKKGEFATFTVELQLIADIGLIGFPNAGKSSLLNSVTNANSKVASYAFTTLEPHLGDYHGYVIADIPGLIDGASEGKGLGHKFLRHITRTRILVHLVSVENENVVSAYKTIRAELEKYNPDLLNKREIVILTKVDVAPQSVVEKKKKELEKACHTDVLTLSLYDDSHIKALSNMLSTVLSSKDILLTASSTKKKVSGTSSRAKKVLKSVKSMKSARKTSPGAVAKKTISTSSTAKKKKAI